MPCKGQLPNALDEVEAEARAQEVSLQNICAELEAARALLTRRAHQCEELSNSREKLAMVADQQQEEQRRLAGQKVEHEIGRLEDAEELAALTREAEAEEELLQKYRQRLAWLPQLQETLKFAADAFPRSRRDTGDLPHTNGMIQKASNEAGRDCDWLQDRLIELVSQLVGLEIEANVVQEQIDSERAEIGVLLQAHEALQHKYEATQAALNTGAEALEELCEQRRCAEYRDARDASIEESHRRSDWFERCDMRAIDARTLHMIALKQSCRVGFNSAVPTLAATLQTKKQAELMHSERLAEIASSGRVGLDLARARLLTEQQARAIVSPVTLQRSVDVRPESDHRLILPEVEESSPLTPLAGRRVLGQAGSSAIDGVGPAPALVTPVPQLDVRLPALHV